VASASNIGCICESEHFASDESNDARAMRTTRFQPVPRKDLLAMANST